MYYKLAGISRKGIFKKNVKFLVLVFMLCSCTCQMCLFCIGCFFFMYEWLGLLKSQKYVFLSTRVKIIENC